MRFRAVFLLGIVGAFTFIGIGHAQVLPFPETADILMSNFHSSYSDMNLEEYGQVLHTDYRFIFQPFDVEDLGLPTEYIARDEELIIATNTFLGLVEPVVAQINFNIFEPVTVWETSDHPDFPPPAMRRVYIVSMAAARPSYTTIIVEGHAEFFAIARDSVIEGGSVVPYWQLLGHRDLTGLTLHQTESTSWGQFKWAYRGDTVPVSENDLQPTPAQLTNLYPNPFNPSLAVSFAADQAQNLRISVHDLAGRRVALLTERVYGLGTHTTRWNGRNSAGRAVASGVYVVRLESAGQVETRKIILAR